MLPVKKIYVDSKYKTADSKSDSNFKFQLPQTCYMPDDTKFFISDVCIPHSWYSINSFNCKLYLRTFDGNGNQEDYIIELDQKTYNGSTFATELANKIQAKTTIAPTKSFNATTNQLTMHIGSLLFQFLTDKELQDPLGLTNFAWNGDSYNKSNLQSANAVISNTGDNSVVYTNPPSTHVFNQQLQLQPIRNVYIHSTNLGSFTTIGAKGEQTIIKKVPVNNNYSEMIFSDYNAGMADMMDCSKQTLKQLHFIITNVDGQEIPFHGNHVSFSIVFNN